MDERLWRRKRRHRRAVDDDRRGAPTEPTASTAPKSPNAARKPTGVAADERSDLADALHPLDLGDTGDKRAEYAEWVERMRAKRDEKRDTVRQLASDSDERARPSYWSPDFVWEESRRLAEEGTAVASRADHMAVLGLGPDATDAEIVATYRRLAKEHHPDRYPDADAETVAFHVEQMQRFTSAYRALQQPGSRS